MPVAQFSGLASGIDSGALIDAIIQAREIRNDIRRDEISHLESENEALEELNTKFLALDGLIDKFRTANGGGISKSANSSDSTIATASTSSSAIDAAYSLTVTSVANTATGSFDNAYTASDDYVSATGSGDVTITIGTGADQVSIVSTVTSNVTTLDDLVSDINNDANASGRGVASVVNIGTDASPDYRLLFTTQESGTEKGTLSLSADGAITELAASTISQAADAVFSISGISSSITRSSNTVDDVISGVTFTLLDAGSTDITVGTDASSTATKISEIVDAFNEIVEYINENDTVEQVEDSRDGSNVYGTLAKTHLDNDFLAAFRSSMLSAEAADGEEVTSLAELGLQTNRDGTITFDETDFTEAVGADSDGATSVLNDFADSISGVDGTVYQYTKLGGFIDIAQDTNDDQVNNLQDAIAQLERQTAKQRESLEKQFTNLERITGELQSEQQALTGVLAGLAQ